MNRNKRLQAVSTAITLTTGFPGARVMSAYLAMHYEPEQGYASPSYQDFGRDLGISNPSTSFLTSELAEQGLWQSVPHPQDGRRRVYRPLFLDASLPPAAGATSVKRTAAQAGEVLTLLSQALSPGAGNASLRLIAMLAALRYEPEKGYAPFTGTEAQADGISGTAFITSLKKFDEGDQWRVERRRGSPSRFYPAGAVR